jgi:hypothetical protein
MVIPAKQEAAEVKYVSRSSCLGGKVNIVVGGMQEGPK